MTQGCCNLTLLRPALVDWLRLAQMIAMALCVFAGTLRNSRCQSAHWQCLRVPTGVIEERAAMGDCDGAGGWNRVTLK